MRSLMLTALVLMAGVAFVAQADDQLHVVEMYFVVEPEVTRKYISFGYNKAEALANIKGDIQYYIYQVNELFKSTASRGLNIEIRQKKVDFLSEEMFEACKLVRKNELQSDLALEVFMEWLKKTDAHKKIGYDIALVWTGFDIFDTVGRRSVLGYATRGATCRPDRSVAIVEFDGLFDTVVTTAHEIGHSLGSGHDVTAACSPSAGYIMAEKTAPTNKKRWEFSDCSVRDMLTYINKLNSEDSNCLTPSKTTTRAQSFQMSSQAGRDILDLKKICSRKVLRDTEVCTSPTVYSVRDAPVKGDVLCRAWFCHADGNTCTGTLAPEGAVCDVNKRCEKGRCVAASFPTPSGIDPSCFLGDDKKILFEHPRLDKKLGCKDLITEFYPKACYGQMYSTCCATCNERRTGIDGCEYGDKSVECSKHPPENLCPRPSNAASCCYTCRNYVAKRSDSNTTEPQVTLTPDQPGSARLPVKVKVDNEDENVVATA